MQKAIAINVADIVEENGKTVRQNNSEKKHNIPIGSLVEVKFHTWHGGGACEKTHARLWVIEHTRDCDETPLYSLSAHKEYLFDEYEVHCRNFILKKSVSRNLLNNIHTGFAERDLKVIEVTPELEYGHGSLDWRNEDV